jgi:hypothetical protein
MSEKHDKIKRIYSTIPKRHAQTLVTAQALPASVILNQAKVENDGSQDSKPCECEPTEVTAKYLHT